MEERIRPVWDKEPVQDKPNFWGEKWTEFSSFEGMNG